MSRTAWLARSESASGSTTRAFLPRISASPSPSLASLREGGWKGCWGGRGEEPRRRRGGEDGAEEKRSFRPEPGETADALPQNPRDEARGEGDGADDRMIEAIGASELSWIRNEIGDERPADALDEPVVETVNDEERDDMRSVPGEGEPEIENGVEEPASGDDALFSQKVRETSRRGRDQRVDDVETDEHPENPHDR